MNIDELLAQLRKEWLSDMADLENRLRGRDGRENRQGARS